MPCSYCGKRERYVCDHIDGSGICGREVCEDHVTPEYEDGTPPERDGFTLCRDHADCQIPRDAMGEFQFCKHLRHAC